MTYQIVVSTVALLISFGFALWSVWYNLNNKSSNKTNKTTDLSIIFNTGDFMESRRIAWSLLDEVNRSEFPITFKMLWSDFNDKTKTRRFQELYTVLSFWHMLYVLGQQNEINTKLANKLFQYEFYHWHQQATELIKNTYNAKEDLPGFVEAFIKKPKWLFNKE